jgi:hypothetical protein
MAPGRGYSSGYHFYRLLLTDATRANEMFLNAGFSSLDPPRAKQWKKIETDTFSTAISISLGRRVPLRRTLQIRPMYYRPTPDDPGGEELD